MFSCSAEPVIRDFDHNRVVSSCENASEMVWRWCIVGIKVEAKEQNEESMVKEGPSGPRGGQTGLLPMLVTTPGTDCWICS